MSGLNDFVDFIRPLSTCRLTGNGSAEIFVDEESFGSVIELPGCPTEGLGKGNSFRKGITAPPDAACCGVKNPLTIMPRMMPRRKGTRRVSMVVIGGERSQNTGVRRKPRLRFRCVKTAFFSLYASGYC